MAASGLAQIDENCSLLQTTSNERLLLPNLLRSTPQLDSMGEKTPEMWPKTPTPHGFYSGGFALGDQTPESWPDAAPSFRMDSQQQSAGFQATPGPFMLPTAPMNSVPQLVPMWQGQMAYPLGMVVDGNMMSMANMCAPANPMPPAVLYNGNTAIAHAVERPAQEVPRPPAPAHTLAPVHSSSTKFTPPKKFSRPANPDAGSDDACPVAVYVDLSALRERIPRQGSSRR